MAEFIRSVFIIIIVITVTGCVDLTPIWWGHEKPAKEELEILEQLIGKSSEEVIKKLGLPDNHLVLDGQHFLIYHSSAEKYNIELGFITYIPIWEKSETGPGQRCLMIETGTDNLVQEYTFDYIGWPYHCLNFFFSESELEHATLVIDQVPFDGQVTIDIRPHSYSNHVDPASKEDISVAVLSAMNFDARSVNPSTVAFGPAQVAISSYQTWKDVDVNDDGLVDRIFFFRISETGIVCGDKEAILTGQTFEGFSINETDWVMTVNCD